MEASVIKTALNLMVLPVWRVIVMGALLLCGWVAAYLLCPVSPLAAVLSRAVQHFGLALVSAFGIYMCICVLLALKIYWTTR